ncbi:MAG: DNA-formamidopyrimidine glycosylase family protein [Candidatus Thorarchaeota archaeon]
MPELPELEAIASKLTERFKDEEVLQAAVLNHLLLYNTTVDQFQNEVTNSSFESFRADGKFLVIKLTDSMEIVVNPMLTGRFKVSHRSKRPTKTDVFALRLKRETLWYSDRKQMGRVYLVKAEDYGSVAEFTGRGPSPLDSELTLDIFKERLKRHRGQIKNVLRNQKLVKGIGNAYADEILLYAGILPFRKRSSLSDDEVSRLFNAMQTILGKFLDLLFKRSIEEIGLEKRDFLMIHGRYGDVCALCGNRVSEVKANRFKTNYCQKCQI